ncbi:MAG: hypothetical protein JNL58_18035 [Planctomyces sp.]|nr:hypothetical protein [Planctomyces sp.]
MTNLNSSDPSDRQLASLLKQIDGSLPEPDFAALDAIAVVAAAAFDQAATSKDVTLTIVQAEKVRDTSQQNQRRHPMFTLLASRALASIAAIASTIALWFAVSFSTPTVIATPFSKVLSELQRADSIQLKIVREDTIADVWIRTPGLVRYQESSHKYQIAAGSRLWKIDEASNTVEETDSPWFLSPQERIDLLSLLDSEITDASRLLNARPVDRENRDGIDCLIYRVHLPSKDGEIEIEAAVDSKNLRLLEIAAWDPESKRIGPPLAEMTLVALNVAVADEQFSVSKSLSEDRRIGDISESQGIVVLRPRLAKRWTPISSETLVQPGDWLRTDVRGANAVRVQLTNGSAITLGPGSLIELISLNEARLHYGIVQVVVAENEQNSSSLNLLAPQAGQKEVKPGQSLILRTDQSESLIEVPQKPSWLQGFEGASNNESLGSLLVTMPDGRNEPLTVGYHKVSVEIRDQIARTTIEESFVNHTASQLEGIFHFPLPQDASISGFGMWIGNQLVEADVVEKQRAREIYETILRERRDPGLLEWTSGNVFKARVFPIEARSEKRIKIVYTQVLPLRANKYRYSYGLRSELLRTKPLRELSLSVNVNSALPLKQVTCPTHSTRTQLTEHSAQVDFSAQEYSPNRDFEVVFELDERQNDVVVIPHQRGDDGYFLIQLTPPGGVGNWQREVLPEGAPLRIVLLCDTSMSMDEAKRRDQMDFVASILASLGPEDQFQLVAADVATAWGSGEMQAATASNVEAAKAFLADRISLGWTNLDRAYEDVLVKVPADANVIYIGDGMLSAGDTDAPAFVKRLAQMPQLAQNSQRTPDKQLSQITLHTVTVGNTSDSVVMRGIATVGRGSSRVVSGEQTSQVVATELLNEIAQPGLRDLKIEFKGLKVAAVYPEQLPNIPAGTQQILVGRYLPEGKAQTGEVIVSGRRGSELVRYAARIDLKHAEDGNSFIPRLWARSHLDHLLAQGTNSAIQDDVVRLSEEFHIITPYTSLLVLESDNDRERFGVKRRYEMRDGERFFAEGRANANFELLQQQMKLAGTWRLNLRRQILQELSGLGRSRSMLEMDFKRQQQWNRPMSASGGMGGGFGGGGFNGRLGFEPSFGKDQYGIDNRLGDSDFDSLSDSGEIKEELAAKSERDEMDLGRKQLSLEESSLSLAKKSFDGPADMLVGLRDEMDAGFADNMPVGGGFGGDDMSRYMMGEMGGLRGGLAMDKSKNAIHFFDSPMMGRGYYNEPDYTSWLNTLFPSLPVVQPTPDTPNLEVVDQKSKWTPEASALASSLLRIDQLRAVEGGIELRREIESLDPVWNRKLNQHGDLALYSPGAWVTRGNDLSQQTVVNFCDGKERGVYSVAFGLGRLRPSTPKELETPPFQLNDFSISSIRDVYGTWKAVVETENNQTSRLVLSVEGSQHRMMITVDTVRHVVTKIEQFEGDKLTSTTTFEDFVEIAGTWWARHVQTFDAQNRRLVNVVLNVQKHTPEQYAQRMNAALAEKAGTQFLSSPSPRLSAARQRVADGSAAFDDRIIMILHNARLQQWDELWIHVEAAEKLSTEKLSTEKSGVRWIRTMLQNVIRRHEEAKVRLTAEASRLSSSVTGDEVFLAEFLLGQLNSFASAQEFYDVHQQLKPVYFRSMNSEIQEMWIQREASALERLGKSQQALAVFKSIAESRSWDVYAQQAYTDRLQQIEGFDVAEAWLRREDARPERTEYDHSVLRPLVFNLLKSQAKWSELVQWTTDWVADSPNDPQYYTAYGYHLAALILGDKLDQVHALVDQWLKEARVEGELSPPQRQKVEAALNFLNGQIPGMSFQWRDERPFELLADTARFFAKHQKHFDLTNRCFSGGYFGQSEPMDKLRGEWLSHLRTNAADIPADRLSSFISWTMSGRLSLTDPIDDRRELDGSEVPDRIWNEIAVALKDRWLRAEVKVEKQQLSDAIVMIYVNRFRSTLMLPFLRERIARASDDSQFGPSECAAYLAGLFEELLQTKWSIEVEEEAFSILRQLSIETEPHSRTLQEVPSLIRLVDVMLANRITAGEQQLHDQGETDLMTRKQLVEKKAAIRETAHKEMSLRLAEQATKSDGPIGDWFRMEQIWVDVGLGQNLSEAEAACWKILGDAPPLLKLSPDEIDDEIAGIVDGAAPSVPKPQTDAETSRELLELQLRTRAFATVMHLASRSKADPLSVQRLLKFVDAGVSQSGNPGSAWRQTKFRLLVALDRPEELETALRDWVRTDIQTAPWRQMLARLLAERGQLPEAVTLFEACEQAKLLSAQDYRSLANWYLALDRRNDYERALVEAYRQMPEQYLAQLLYAASNRWYQNGATLPSELSDEALMAVRVLFEKSGSPESYFSYVNSIYSASRDFRMLKLIPDSVLGRTAQQIYPILQSIQNNVLGEVRNEATADELIARIQELRKRKLTPVDRRALDLMEAVIERKSAEVLNQPGPHLEASVNAMKRAFEHEWSENEPQMMASFLRQLGNLSHPAMKNEQLRQLRALRQMVPENSRPRLQMTLDLCELLLVSYDDRAGALNLLEIEFRGYSQANQDMLPNEDTNSLFRYVSLLETVHDFAGAENLLKKYISKPVHRQQEIELKERLRSLYVRAMDADGSVSIGNGRDALLESIFTLLKTELNSATDENQRYIQVIQMVDLLQTARRHSLVACVDRVKELTFEIIPKVLPLQQENYRETVSHPLTLIRDTLGHQDRLRYLVERLEQYPQRFLVHYEQPWETLGYELCIARKDAGPSEYDDRVLRLLLPELKRYLTSPNPSMLTACYIGYTEFWSEKADEFAKFAEEILNERRDSGQRVFRVSQYLHSGLGRIPRAIEIMLIAREQGRLDENMHYTLVRWLRDASRLPESIEILEMLTELRPDNMIYRTDLMSAYFAAQRAEQLQRLIENVDAHFHSNGRWSESVAAQFAGGCQAVNELDRAKKYLTEAIVLHQRGNPASGVNDQTLSGYYQQLASIDGRLGNTREAVNAAVSAITCWSSLHEYRQQTIETLKSTLRSAGDLDALIQQLDQEAEQSGQDNPILRKAIGQVWQERGEHPKAIIQLKLALELQPNDRETHQALVAAYDATDDRNAANVQLRKLIDLMPHELTLYSQLADRLKDDPSQSERAATSIIESSPNEAESHQAYAERLQTLDRWPETIPHWKQVAQYRKLEPTGLLRLAEAQIHVKRFADAQITLKSLRTISWPSRFTDIDNQIRNLESQLINNPETKNK